MKLTRAQQLAVNAVGKNILVSAGAGTGKTRVLVERFLHFVTTRQALVTEILALTFTEKAANEMKSRILMELKGLGLETARRDLESASISTFHSFASRLLKEHPLEAAVDPDFFVIESDEADLLKEEALDHAIEEGCKEIGKGKRISATFDLLRLYNERTLREGILRIFTAARTDGLSLSEFFEKSRARSSAYSLKSCENIPNHLKRLADSSLLTDWERFSKIKHWDWEALQDYSVWFDSFSRRGEKESRRERNDALRWFYGFQLEQLATVWREKFEPLALAFESAYEALKREKSLLDFDDLQIKALQLFKKEKPVHEKLRRHYQQLFKFVLVDEFQDTNPLQLEFAEILSSGNNLFLVGDYKQSIYGFRGAVPELFLEKEKRYRAGEGGVWIPLVENFRASQPVLEFVNLFFKKLWEEDGFEFEELVASAEDLSFQRKRESTSMDPRLKHAGMTDGAVEILITELDKEEGEKLDYARMWEAQGIARRIQELHENEKVEYGKIAILFQALTKSGIYEQALKQAGVPYFVVAGRGFYHQPEIRDILSFLTCLENPLSDIALAATLRSPFFQITDDTLYWLARYAKQADEMNPLYSAVRHFEVISEISEAEKEKLRFFQSLLAELLAEKDRLRLTELLDKILEATSFELHALAHLEGTRRFANLRKLSDLAREYEAHERISLGEFIRTIRGLQTREIRESEAQVEAEQSGRVVRLMTIHQAKGLEFPVVIVADLAHQRMNPESKSFIAQAGAGYSFELRNEKTLEREQPLSWEDLKEMQEMRERAEWKRLLYVAMTRASQRLILSGIHQKKKNPKENFHEMSSWMEWVMVLRANFPDSVLVRQIEKSRAPHRRALVLAEKKVFRSLLEEGTLTLPSPFQGEGKGEGKAERDPSASEADKILARLAPQEKNVSRVIDLPVSAYAAYRKDPRHWRRVYEIGYPDHGDFEGELELGLPEEEVTPADFGTAMHRALQRLDFKNPKKNLAEILGDSFRGMEKDRVQEAHDLLEAFITSPSFGRLRTAGRVYREIPFVLNKRHGLIHGVIDLLFQDEKGSWHVLDYKTAVGDARKVREAGYDLQIQMYALAAHEILEISPRSGILYFLKNNWEHEIVFDKISLSEFADSLRELQEEILEFRERCQAPEVKGPGTFPTRKQDVL